MQYKQETDKVAILNTPYMVGSKPMSLAEDYEIQRTRKILTIILVVCLGLSVPLLVAAIFESELTDETKSNRRTAKVVSITIGIFLDTFGMFATRTYFTRGLRIFAWLNIIKLFVMGAGISIILFDRIKRSIAILTESDAGTMRVALGVGIGILIFIVLLCSAAFVLSGIIVKLAFTLARAIDDNKCVIIQQACFHVTTLIDK